MVGNLLDRSRRSNLIALGILAVCGLIAAYASVALAGTKTGAVLSLGLTIGPALLYAAITAPLIFPLSAYVFLVPLDSVLDFTAFGTLTRLLGAATALALLFYMLRTKRAMEPPKATVLWLLLVLWMASSMFWAIDVPSAWALLPTTIQLFGLYVIISMMPLRFDALRKIMIAAAAGGVVSAFYGLYMYHTGAGIFKDRLMIKTDTMTLNPDHFAASLLVPVTLCLMAALWSRSLWTKVLSVLGMGVILATIELTGSRGAYLAFAVIVVYLIVRDKHRWQIASIGAVLSALAVMLTGPAYFFQRWALAGVNGGGGRLSIWRVGWIAFKQNWLVGAGYGNFPFAYDRAFMQTFQSFYANWHRASHNILLNAAVELGSIGLILLVLAWAGQFRLMRWIPETDARYPLRLGLEAAILGLFTAGIFADIMIWKYTWLAFMLVVLTRNCKPVETTPTHA